MSPALDEISLKFAIYSRSTKGTVADVGCGEGIASVAALLRGAHVHAIDPDPEALKRLLLRVPAEQHPRLQVTRAALPRIDFRPAEFAAIHAGYVLHLLDGTAIEQSMRQFRRWLSPGGKLFLTALTPMGDFWLSLREHFNERLRAGNKWPGHISEIAPLFRDRRESSSVHLLDERILRRELSAAGFLVDSVTWYAVPWERAQVACGVIASPQPLADIEPVAHELAP